MNKNHNDDVLPWLREAGEGTADGIERVAWNFPSRVLPHGVRELVIRLAAARRDAAAARRAPSVLGAESSSAPPKALTPQTVREMRARRERIATAVLAGITANDGSHFDPDNPQHLDMVIGMAVKMADALGARLDRDAEGA